MTDADLMTLGRAVLLLAGCLPQPAANPAVMDLLTSISERLIRMETTFDTELTQLRDDVAAQGSVILSATTAFKGLAAQLAVAEASATAAGATAEQTAGVKAVRETLEAQTASLAAAIPAGTPAATVTGTADQAASPEQGASPEQAST